MDKRSYPQRKHPCHRIIELPHKPLLVFVTVGIADRRYPWLAADDVHQALRRVWEAAIGWCVNYYTLMPDHMHFFTFPGTMDVSLKRWVVYWKEQFRKTHRIPEHSFEMDFWDTTIRSGAHYDEKYQYMRMNAVNRGLVANPDDWPYQGKIHDFIWMET